MQKIIYCEAQSSSTIVIIRSKLRYFIGWIHGKRALKTLGLELLDEYEFPQPMPKDMTYDYHFDTNQAYLMIATDGTGKLNKPLFRKKSFLHSDLLPFSPFNSDDRFL